eukprot:Lithocolla_globosa_v1_NODE_3636_length_1620_cov_3.261342.p2 type:complete len:107 gc:universal NODE_3636_length_1620_cov_3.261342:1240-1560(+)
MILRHLPHPTEKSRPCHQHLKLRQKTHTFQRHRIEESCGLFCESSFSGHFQAEDRRFLRKGFELDHRVWCKAPHLSPRQTQGLAIKNRGSRKQTSNEKGDCHLLND